MKECSKKGLVLVFGMVALLCLAGCSKSEEEDDVVGLANPFIDCQTLEEAEGVAGLSMSLPEVVEGYTFESIRAIEGNMIDVIYVAGSDEINLRKAVGSENISGVYTEYDATFVVTVDQVDVECQANEELVFVATWVDDSYSYSIYASAGILEEQITELVTGMMLE